MRRLSIGFLTIIATFRVGAGAETPSVDALVREGRYEEAEQLARIRLAETDASDSIEIADRLDDLVEALTGAGEFRAPETQELARRAVEIRRSGGEALALAVSLTNLAIVLHLNAGSVEARPLVEESLALRRAALGEDHADVAESLAILGLVQDAMGEEESARVSMERALEIRLATLGPDHPDVAESLLALGWYHHWRAEYEAARDYYARALAVRERSLGPDHPRVVLLLHNLAAVNLVLEDHETARLLYERALAAHETAPAPSGRAMAQVLTGLALIHRASGDYKEAKDLYRRALAIQEESTGPDADYADTLFHLADLARLEGDLEEARDLHERALAIRRENGASDESIAESLAAVAWVLYLRGDLPESRSRFERAVRMEESFDDPAPLGLANALTGLAACLAALGDPEGAIAGSRRALTIREEVYGADHHSLIWPLQVMGDALSRSGRHDDAILALRRALEITEHGAWTDHPEKAEILTDQARAVAALGRGDEALELALRAERVGRDHVLTTARFLPERRALLYAESIDDGLNVMLSLLAAEPFPSSTRARVWDAVIRARALVLDEIAARRRAKPASIDDGARAAREELARARQRLANLVVRGPGDLSPEAHDKLIAVARRERELAEERLAESGGGDGTPEAPRPGFPEVVDRLPPASALIAYLQFDRLDFSRTDHSPVPTYGVFVVRAGDPLPHWTTLGPAADVDALVDAWRREVVEGASEAAYRRAGEALRRGIWDPISPQLRDARSAFIVPDGSLNLVSWASLPIRPGEYLVDAEILVHLLSAERDLVPPPIVAPPGTGLLALGGADFDDRKPFAALAGEGAAFPPEPWPFGGSSPCPDLQSLTFEPLPATAREAGAVADLWDAAGDDRAAVRLLGGQATESAFKRLVEGRRVVHLATHGFFLDGRCGRARSGTRGLGGLNPRSGPRPPRENPLVLSGLALAGANHRSAAGPDEDDGILTAEEIAALDLAGVEWAVLSACDTGLGEIRAGEGVFGIRRALRIAGARTVVMSLWSVEDEAAAVWMRSLYEQRLAEGRDAASAVRAASRATLERRRKGGESTHPFYWAGFVAAGN